MNQKLCKWLKWLGEVHKEIEQLLIARHIFWSVQKLIESNSRIHQESAFYGYLGDTYISHILIGIRRQLKADKDSISFVGLLTDISNEPHHLTRDYFNSLYVRSGENSTDKESDRFDPPPSVLTFREKNLEKRADEDFMKLYQPEGKDHISPDMVRGDIYEIKEAAKNCEEFADRLIAHRDKRAPRCPPTFEEVDKVVDILERLYIKYHLIFHALPIAGMMPTYQNDWQAIFDERWRLPSDE